MNQFLQFILTGRYSFLHFTNIPYICIFITICVFIFNVHLVSFINNYGQDSALKVAYFFKVFGTQSCLIFSQWFNQVTHVFEKCNNLLDSKSIFMICYFKFFPIIFLRQLNLGALSVSKLFFVHCKGKTPFLFICSFY